MFRALATVERTVLNGGTFTYSISEFMKLAGEVGLSDTMVDGFTATLAMGIIACICATMAVVMAIVNKLNMVPPMTFIVVVGVQVITTFIAFVIVASVSDSCYISVSNLQNGAYGTGFAFLIIAWLISMGDSVVEVIVFLGRSNSSSSNHLSQSMNSEAITAGDYTMMVNGSATTEAL